MDLPDDRETLLGLLERTQAVIDVCLEWMRLPQLTPAFQERMTEIFVSFLGWTGEQVGKMDPRNPQLRLQTQILRLESEGLRDRIDKKLAVLPERKLDKKRDDWLCDEWLQGIGYSKLAAALKRVAVDESWKIIRSVNGIKKAIARSAKRRVIKLPPGKPGKPKSAPSCDDLR